MGVSMNSIILFVLKALVFIFRTTFEQLRQAIDSSLIPFWGFTEPHNLEGSPAANIMCCAPIPHDQAPSTNISPPHLHSTLLLHGALHPSSRADARLRGQIPSHRYLHHPQSRPRRRMCEIVPWDPLRHTPRKPCGAKTASTCDPPFRRSPPSPLHHLNLCII